MEPINYAEDVTAPSDQGLSKIAGLAELQLVLEQQVQEIEDRLKDKKEQLKKVQEFDLPEAMAEVGVASFTMANGCKVNVKPYYSGKIDEENCDACFGWLRDNEFGDLIKHELTIGLPKGEDEKAKELTATLRAMGLGYKDKEGVHPSTLSAFIREQVEKGAAFPLETFKAYIGRKAKITTK
jgi:hypothetical protein